MNINVPSKLEGLFDKAYRTFASSNPMAFDSMKHDTINLSTGSVDIDAGALYNPIYVHDSLISNVQEVNATMDALYKQGKLGSYYSPNGKGKWDVKFAQGNARKLTGDSLPEVMSGLTMDAAGPMVAGALLSPNSISWITEVFKQPLSWSDASSLVKLQTGTDPWAVAQAMPAASYSGWGAVNSAGTAGNTMSQDVEVKLDALIQQVINIDVTYKLTIEELKRAESGNQSYPLAGQLIAEKQKYAKWIGDIIRDGLIYYGNSATGNAGLFTVNSITDWTSLTLAMGVNQTLATIAADVANTTKGSKAYQQLAQGVVAFLNPLKNKVKKVNIRMSVEAFNLFTTLPYSDAYNPANAGEIFKTSFGAGGRQTASTVMGGVPVEIAPDPMLSGSGKGNFFNSQTYDYMVMTADEIGTGPSDESQSMIHYGQPLPEFVYPVIPQMMSTQYRYMKRVSGIFAPCSGAVKVFSNYGYVS